jgi:Caspase domain
MADIAKSSCPQCKKSLRVPVELLNKKVRCKHCGAVIRPQPIEDPPLPPSRDPKAKSPKAPAPPPPPPVLADEPEPIIRLAPRPRQSPVVKWLRLVVSLVLLAVAGGVVVVYWDHFRSVAQNLREMVEEKIDGSKAASEKPDAKPAREVVADSGPIYPRRLLAIFPSDYLYANHVSPGTFDRSFASLVQHLVTGLHIDPGQVCVLSDETVSSGSAKQKAGKQETAQARVPLNFPKIMPTRLMFEKACTEFLAASRPQDRIIILFIGHSAVIDDKSYLAPLDADLADKDTLVPLSWLFDKLSQCKARQKVLFLDSCRLDPGRGVDRPASGPMAPAFVKALEQAPAGVEVWSACQAEQYSYEIDGQSVFLDKLCEALTDGTLIAADKPELALPLGGLRDTVQAKVEKEVSKVLKAKQASLWSGKMNEQGAAYDAQELFPPRFVLTTPEPATPPGAAEDVRQILKELKLPPIQLSMAEDEKMDLDGVVFFARDKLAPYLPDYRSLAEIRGNPAKYPLRIAVLDTLELLNKEFGSGNAKEAIRQFYSASATPDAKNRILNEQKKPAQLLLSLQEARRNLEKAGEMRDEEKAKRWQANFDYTHAELLARIAFLEEYNLMLGRIRKDELPELEKGVDEGWRLTPREKLQSPKDVRDLATLAHKEFAKLAKEHAGTPWEVLARREAATSLGLQWQPSKR